MARTFSGTSFIDVTIGACNIVPPASLAFIIRRNENLVFHTLLTHLTAAKAAMMTVLINDSTNAVAIDASGGRSTSSFAQTVADGWCLLAITKPVGSTVARFHRYVYGTDTWTHAAGTGNTNWTGPGTDGFVRLGCYSGTSDPYRGDMLVAAMWDRELSDAETEQLAFGLQHWHGLSPKGMWLLDQSLTSQLVRDLTGGGANESLLTSTAIATNHPPIWNRHGEVLLVRGQAAAAGGKPGYYRHLQRVAAQ